MSNNINYGEIICNAVDEIVTAKLQGLSYDITKQCTIVNDSLRKQGKYTVSDGSVRFEACSEDTTLSKGNSVLVTIPNGDYNMQKMIIGRIAADSTEPFNYKSPLNNMAKFTSNILDQPGITYPKENTGLQANGKTAIIGPIYSISDADNFSGFTRLGVSADFRSWLGEYNVIKGAYGLKLLVYVDGSSAPGVKNELVYELTFSSEDMIGNPYQFDTYFTQEKVFDISSLNSIKRIDVYFYQDGQFYDGNLLPVIYDNIFENEDIGLDSNLNEMNNLFVNNVGIYLGYESSMFEEETLMLYSSDPLTYHYLAYPPFTAAGAPKNLALRWVHKIDDTNFEILNGINLDDKFEVHWFRYKPGAKNINQFAGPDWEELPWPQDLSTVLDKINPNDFSSIEEYQAEVDRTTEIYIEQYAGDRFKYSFLPDATNQQEQIKVVGYFKQGYGDNSDTSDIANTNVLSNVIAYTSNILTFRNEEQVPDNLTYVASTQLTISYEDNSDGNYFVYNQNGKIINEGEGQGHNRRVQARFRGAPLTSSIGTIDYIKWYLPFESQQGNTYTMIISDNNENYEIEDYRGIDYMVFTRYPNEDGEIDNYQSYSIKNTWYQANNNNVIRCVVSINGVLYEAIEEMKFGKAGSQGTNITLVLDFMYGKNALEYDPEAAEDTESEIYVQAIMYDMAGKRIYDKYGTWTWSWYNGDNDIIKINDTEIITGATGEEIEVPINSNIIKLSAKLDKVPANNYAVLQVAYEQTASTTLYAYLPIPIKQKGYSHIEGAREVIYNHQGVPSYYTDAYVLYRLDSVTGKYYEVLANWDLNYEDELELENGSTSSMSESYIPSLQNLTKEGKVYKALAASPFYASGYDNRVCVICYDIEDKEKIYWSQPILIMQSKYDFAMLNEWDGKLKTDESKGTILSTMLGAGRKNKNNTFSGVLIGDVQDATDFVEGGSYLKVGKIGKNEFKIGKYYTYRNYAYYPAFIYDENTEYYTIQNLTGVYGLHEGQISFSLKENGIATFGKAGKGQIIINGNESTIKSSSFDSVGTGLKLDLDDGLFHIKDRNRNKVIIKPDEPYLSVFGESSEIPIIHIGDTEYFLQSDKYAIGGLGSKLDLVKGTFTVKGSGGSIVLSGDKDESFLKVQDISQNTLINMNNKEYYLQSATYGGNTQVILKDTNNIEYLLYEDENGDIIALDSLNRDDIHGVTEKGIQLLKDNWNNITTGDSFTPSTGETSLDSIISEILFLDTTDLSYLIGTGTDLINFLNNHYDLLEAIAKEEGLTSFTSQALKEFKCECIKHGLVKYDYLNVKKNIETHLQAESGKELSYPSDTTALFIVKNQGEDLAADNRYQSYEYNQGSWRLTSNYTQMQLNGLFAFADMYKYIDALTVNEIGDETLHLKDTTAWEFKFLFSILGNLKSFPTGDSESNSRANILKLIKILFKINGFDINTEKGDLKIEKLDIPNYMYNDIQKGTTEKEVKEVSYNKVNVTEDKFSEGTYYEYDRGYKIATIYKPTVQYYTKTETTSTKNVEIFYPTYLSEYINYLIPIPLTAVSEEAEGSIVCYGVKCEDLELNNIYKKIYFINESSNNKDFSGIREIENGQYNEDGNPIKVQITVDHDTGKAIYISNLTPLMTASKPNGLKINLNTGLIDGYNLYLQGIGEKGTFVLNSQDATTPFKIGSNLSISWDGQLFCQGVQYIGTVPADGNIINIGNGFYVNKNGGGRFAGKSADADHADKADKADYASSAWNASRLENHPASDFASSKHEHDLKTFSGSVTLSKETTLFTNWYSKGELQSIVDNMGSGRRRFSASGTVTITDTVALSDFSSYSYSLGPAKQNE